MKLRCRLLGHTEPWPVLNPNPNPWSLGTAVVPPIRPHYFVCKRCRERVPPPPGYQRRVERRWPGNAPAPRLSEDRR